MPSSPNSDLTYHPFGDTGPLVDDLVAGKIQVPTPEAPPADVVVERVPGGGFIVSYGRWLGRRQIEFSKKSIILKKVLGTRIIPIASLSSILIQDEGLLFTSRTQQTILWPADTHIIRSWLHDLLLRNLVTSDQSL